MEPRPRMPRCLLIKTPHYFASPKCTGHPQPPTPIHCDNATAVGITNETFKKHRSRPMEMRYFYSCDQVKRRNFDVHWNPGLECLGAYPSKHHTTSHHQNVRPIYLHTKYSPLYLTRAPKPSDLRGCVGKTLADTKGGAPFQCFQEWGAPFQCSPESDLDFYVEPNEFHMMVCLGRPRHPREL